MLYIVGLRIGKYEGVRDVESVKLDTIGIKGIEVYGVLPVDRGFYS